MNRKWSAYLDTCVGVMALYGPVATIIVFISTFAAAWIGGDRLALSVGAISGAGALGTLILLLAAGALLTLFGPQQSGDESR